MDKRYPHLMSYSDLLPHCLHCRWLCIVNAGCGVFTCLLRWQDAPEYSICWEVD